LEYQSQKEHNDGAAIEPDKFVIPKFDPERLFDLERFWFTAE
jgi:hypothetical protein